MSYVECFISTLVCVCWPIKDAAPHLLHSHLQHKTLTGLWASRSCPSSGTDTGSIHSTPCTIDTCAELAAILPVGTIGTTWKYRSIASNSPCYVSSLFSVFHTENTDMTKTKYPITLLCDLTGLRIDDSSTSHVGKLPQTNCFTLGMPPKQLLCYHITILVCSWQRSMRPKCPAVSCYWACYACVCSRSICLYNYTSCITRPVPCHLVCQYADASKWLPS